MKIEEALEDLAGRFLVHLPMEDTKKSERFFFQMEEAHWFYEDYYRKRYNFPYMPLKEFCTRILTHSNIAYSSVELEEEFKRFLKYKKSIPVFGALIFNGSMTKILLVRGFGSKKIYTFPRGKISKSESEMECAVREVYEEIGYDVELKIIRSFILDMSTKQKISKLYVILNVPEKTKFETKTRNEIKEIRWVDILTIEKSNIESLSYIKSYIKQIKNVAQRVECYRITLDRKKIQKAFGL